MGYRGRDLDLRTPERWPVPAGQWRGEAQPPGALLVDEVVLACCNHAYDLALAHRAREVRIEHLLNAMSRTDAAIAVMAGHGIDAAGLRQDTARVIATDDTVIPAHERLSPRRSQELADVLNSAAAGAMQRNASANVADVLRALFELNSEQPGLAMLKRNTPGWQQRSAVEAPRSEPLPPLIGGSYPHETRYGQPDPRGGEPPRDWGRMPSGQASHYQAPQATYYGGDPLPPQAYYSTETQTQQPAGNLTDAVQNNRLDLLERTIRELSDELLAERKVVSQLVGELKRDHFGHGEAGKAVRGALDDRPGGAEYVAAAGRPDGGASSQLIDHLVMIERNVDAKFADVARGWTVLGERLQALEQTVASGRAEAGMPSGLLDNLRGLESIGGTLTMLADRLTVIERQLAARPAAASAASLEPIVERLAAIERTVASRVSPVDFSPLLDRLTAIEGRIGAGDRAAQQSTERQGAIEEALVAQRDQVAELAANLTADVKALAQGIASQPTSDDRIEALVGERLKDLAGAFDDHRLELAALVEGQRTETGKETAELANKLGALEKVVQGFGQRTLELHGAHGADLVELHNAFVKLNANQQTMAGTIDQWRAESGSELNTLLTRLDGVERSSAKPMQLLESVQGNVLALQRSNQRREEQRGRFKMWLMGTDDWYGASWESAGSKDQAATGSAAASHGTAAPQR
jgi:hypothetical protein